MRTRNRAFLKKIHAISWVEESAIDTVFTKENFPECSIFILNIKKESLRTRYQFCFYHKKRPSLNNWPLFLIKSRSAVLVYSHSDWYIKTKKIILRR